MSDLVLWLDELRMSDLGKVGGKNASLGEMIGNLAKLGVSVPGGFATTAQAFQAYLEKSGLAKRIQDRLATLDVEDIDALTVAGKEIRSWIVDTALPKELDQAIHDAYAKLCKDAGSTDIAVAVRSSATAEDLPDASFAGQQETFLNVGRHRRRAAQGQGSLRLALQRPRDRVSRASRLQARGRVPVRRRAADGALGCRRIRRPVHARHRIGLPRRGVRDRQLRPRRNGRAGRGQSGRVLRLQTDPARRPARDPAPPDRRQAAAHGLFEQARRARAHRGNAGAPTARSSASAMPTCTNWRSSRWSSRSITNARWISSGRKTASPASSTSCRRARKP